MTFPSLNAPGWFWFLLPTLFPLFPSSEGPFLSENLLCAFLSSSLSSKQLKKKNCSYYDHKKAEMMVTEGRKRDRYADLHLRMRVACKVHGACFICDYLFSRGISLHALVQESQRIRHRIFPLADYNRRWLDMEQKRTSEREILPI